MSLKKKLTFLALTLPLLINPVLSNKTEAKKICRKREKIIAYYKQPDGSYLKVIEYPCIEWEDTDKKQSNHSLYKKQTKFTPPELPYCKSRFDGRTNSIVINYWNEEGKRYDLNFYVRNVTSGTVGVSIVLKTLYNTGNYGLYELRGKDKSELQYCIIKGVKKMFKNASYCRLASCSNPDTWILYEFEYAGDNVYMFFQVP